jgi:hypothetical protein
MKIDAAYKIFYINNLEIISTGSVDVNRLQNIPHKPTGLSL